MKIYLAAKFERRLFIRKRADQLWKLGHQITSTWLNETTKPESMTKEIFFRKLAIKDLCEIMAADLIILDTAEQSTRGGKENEFGFALGQFQNKLVYIVGRKRSVFHELADMVFKNWKECIAYVSSQR